MLSEQGSTLFSGINAIIGTLVIIQLWLVSASLEALFSYEPSVLTPATIASFVLFGINGLLLAHALRFDRIRRQQRNVVQKERDDQIAREGSRPA